MRTVRLPAVTSRTITRRSKIIAASCAMLVVGVIALPGAASATPSLSARLASATHVTKEANGGYWLVSSDGVVTAFGGAPLYGSMVGRRLAAPIIGIVATTDAHGYWLVASDGGVFSFGDATFAGSRSGRFHGGVIVGMASSSGTQTAQAGPQGPRGRTGSTGANGVRGMVGPMGVAGPSGAPGANGSNGAIGLSGLAGNNGTNGAPGATGGTGLTGSSGLAGGTGMTGGSGLTGGTGLAGGTGMTGGTGVAGPQGTSGSTNYGLIYNTGAQTVALNAAIIFDSNGAMSGFGHGTGFPAIQANVAGIYRVNFSVSTVEASQFALFVNAVLVPGTTYGSGAGTQQNNGTAILTLNAGDVITVVNHTSASAITLQTLAGGTQTNVNASLLVAQLG